MAGISIELRKILEKEGLANLFIAIGYSALLSSGNWIIAVSSIFLFSTLAKLLTNNSHIHVVYQVYITYTIAISMILSGPLQLMFTRYIADRFFEKELKLVIPNYFGALVLSMSFSFVISLIISLYLFKDLPYYYHIVFSFTVSVLTGIWVTNTLLTAMGSYKYVLLSFLISYTLIGLSLIFSFRYSFIWSFVSFYIGQVILLLLLLIKMIIDYPTDKLIEWDFLKKDRSYYSLALTGFFYNFAIWIDKIIFWFNPLTGENVFANIRFSVVYDIPVILAYISLIPGIAIFFLKIEVQFFTEYDNFYKAVIGSGKLEDLYRLANKMIEKAQVVYYEALRIQGIALIVFISLEEKLLKFLNIPLLYIPLLNVLLVGALLHLGFMVLFALLSYFDRRREILMMSFIFATGNFFLSLISQFLGPYYYGYGYGLSLLIALIVGKIMLRRFLREILYRTFVNPN